MGRRYSLLVEVAPTFFVPFINFPQTDQACSLKDAVLLQYTTLAQAKIVWSQMCHVPEKTGAM